MRRGRKGLEGTRTGVEPLRVVAARCEGVGAPRRVLDAEVRIGNLCGGGQEDEGGSDTHYVR